MALPLIALDRVTVSFDGFKALDDLTFSVMPGGIKVIIGPNGSGKSTLLDTIIGKVHPTAGKVLYNGVDITNQAEHRIAQMGIRRKFQAPGVLGNLSVRDNLAIAVRKSKSLWGNLRPGLTKAEMERVAEVLEIIGLKEKQQMLAANLSHGEKQWLCPTHQASGRKAHRSRD
ncbi:MAG: urea/short-chain amide transporter ATP-binding protein [Dehalococcoidia bacterium]|nr:urea/short-chain amide transporter ATP-binding protein [Dehalococcoidia bacterium]